jgi:hypothetical protein
MAQACYHGYHRIWVFVLAIPCLVLCCVAPLVLFLGLWRNKSKMTNYGFRARYGHLYRLYRTHAYGFEAVILVQTITLVAVSVFASHIGIYTAVLLSALHVSISLQLLQVVRPYASRLLHRVHVAALCCLLLDVFVAMLMFAGPSRGLLGTLAVAQAVVAAIALAMNAWFIVACCVLMLICFFRNSAGAKLQARLHIVARWFADTGLPGKQGGMA